MRSRSVAQRVAFMSALAFAGCAHPLQGALPRLLAKAPPSPEVDTVCPDFASADVPPTPKIPDNVGFKAYLNQRRYDVLTRVGRFRSEGKTIDRVAAALGVRLTFKPPKRRKAGELFADGLGSWRDQLLFVRVKQVHLPVLVRGRAMRPTLSARVAGEFAAAFERYAWA